MSGYTFHHVVRLRPVNGSASVFDLRNLLSDAGGPVETRLRYLHDKDDWTNVNNEGRQDSNGFRPVVRIRADIADMRDHRSIASIMTAAHNPDVAIDLSLDGGFNYREVTVTRMPDPRPFGRKTIAGARFEIEFECVELLDTYPTLDAGGW